MKELIIAGEILFKDDNCTKLDAYDTLLNVLKTPPPSRGATFDEMIKVADALRKLQANKGKKSLLLENEEHQTLVASLNQFRWGVIDVALLEWAQGIFDLKDVEVAKS